MSILLSWPSGGRRVLQGPHILYHILGPPACPAQTPLGSGAQGMGVGGRAGWGLLQVAQGPTKGHTLRGVLLGVPQTPTNRVGGTAWAQRGPKS